MSTLSKRGFRCGSLKIFKLKRNFFFKSSGSSGPCAFGIPSRPPGPVWKPLISESLPGLLLLQIKTETGTCRWRWGRDRVKSPAYFSQSLAQISASVNAFITCIRKRIAVFSSTNSTYTCHHLLKSAKGLCWFSLKFAKWFRASAKNIWWAPRNAFLGT